MYYVISGKEKELLNGRSKTQVAKLLEMSVPHTINVINGKSGVPRTTAMAFCYIRGNDSKLIDYFMKR